MPADDAFKRYANVNLPHARTVAGRIGRTLEALGAFREGRNGGAAALRAALGRVEQALECFEEDPPMDEALRAADEVAALARALAEVVADGGVISDRLGQHVRNLFECLGLAAEGAAISLRCGERADSPLR